VPVWDDVIPEQDRAALTGEWGRAQGFGAQPALLIVDVNYAFVDERFPLAIADGWGCAERVAPLLEIARDGGIPVVYTTGTSNVNAAERGRWKSAPREPGADLPDPHEIVPPLEPRPDESVVRKRRPSGFFGTELASLLIHHRVDTVVLCGLVTSGCVRATAVDAFSHNFRVVVPEECVADRSHVSHAVSLFDVHMKYGDVAPAAEVAAALERHAAAHAAEGVGAR
jgi:maleamate amidohydrolase